ncbi:hypothetical protein LTR56_014318 [Elasticomyces elasticus]|nr:hypothetical protein LTR22_024708 [Elasticomyces elasticus]KAK3636155.1 hypothetical protein LTR56_014318 [Elasticomyces elasticus]KAK4916574.1 hypothetical protein LTR49_015407 [Elasticomyces elasticus]KAK5756189.1 hypothetical protein LTS12_013742 [Elasticomyces elasticus]
MPQHLFQILILAGIGLYLYQWLSTTPTTLLGASSYDETEILDLFTDLYNILIRQGYLQADKVIWAPSEGHDITLSVLDDPDRLDPRIVSLMKKLPVGPDQACIVPNMQSMHFMSPHELVRSRDIDKVVHWELQGPPWPPLNQTNALPTVIQLLDADESTDPVLVLNVADNTIRVFNEVYNGPHHLDVPAEDASSYLRHVLDNYRTGRWIGIDWDIVDTSFMIHLSGYWGPELQRIFLEDYHWPSERFRREDWLQDRDRVVGHLMLCHPDPHSGDSEDDIRRRREECP